MKKIILVLVFLILGLNSCNKSTDEKVAKSDTDAKDVKSDNISTAKVEKVKVDNTPDSCDGMTDIFEVAKSKDDCLKTMKSLVEKGADVNAKDTVGFPLLMYVVKAGHLDIVKYLVEKGADVNAKDDTQGGSTILMFASGSNNLEIVKFLIENGADVNGENNFNNTVLMTAAFIANLEMVKYLVEKGADVKVMGAQGWTALSRAEEAKGDNTELIKYLKDKGAPEGVTQ